MADQNELIEQYRITLDVMREKLANLKQEKDKRTKEIAHKKSTNSDFLKLEQSLDTLQENIQSLSLEIFKEKGSLRKLKAESEWGESNLQSSEELQFLSTELETLLAENRELKLEKPQVSGQSKLDQLETTNPKLFSLVKKIISVEETNTLLKEELSYLEQERNKIRGEYYKITQCLGQEEKIKLRIREVEKETERTQASKKLLEIKVKDGLFDLERTREIVKKSDSKQLLIKYSQLVQKKEENSRILSQLAEEIEKTESEIEVEKTTGCKEQNKEQPSNLKMEIRNLESQITEKSREIKARVLERKKLTEEIEKKSKGKKAKKDNSGSLMGKHLGSKSSVSIGSIDGSKREQIIGIIGKNVIDNNPKELKKVLRSVGSQEMGIATKLVQLNREEFLRNLKLN